uniref:Uncharacterized protein n=1 Tax=Oryza rufipogon TaxID=4529 RepID=A0A0E0P4V6_ORYRU
MHVTPQNSTTYNLSPTQPQDFGITHSSLLKSNPTMHKAEHTFQNDDIKLASSAREQFHEEFGFKRKNLEKEIYRDMMKRLNEFHAKEVVEHQTDGARNLENTEETLEGHHMAKKDIVHVNKSPCFSNTSDKKIQSAINEGQLNFATPGMSHAKDDHLVKQIGLGGLVRRSLRHRWEFDEEANLDAKVYRSKKRAYLLVHKKQLHKLSVEKLRERGMAWVPKGSVQVQNEKDAKVEVEAKKVRRVRSHAPNQWFVSSHQVPLPPYCIYSSPMQPMHMSWIQFSGMYRYPSCPYYNSWISYESLYYGGMLPYSFAY